MSAYILYLLKVSLSLTICYTFYRFFLGRFRRFQWNRFYLLYTTIICFFIPFWRMPFQPSDSSATVPTTIDAYSLAERINMQSNKTIEWIAAPMESSNASFQISIVALLLFIYLAGAGFFLVKLLIRINQLSKIIRQSKRHYLGAIRVLDHDKVHSASFFQHIFLSRNTQPDLIPWILKHELTHARQWHSLDLLILQFISVLQWYNPIIYLITRELRLLHEYQVDEQVTVQYGQKKQYALALLYFSRNRDHALAPGFSRHINKRLEMLKKPPHTHQHPWAYLLIIPFLLGLLLLFAQMPAKAVRWGDKQFNLSFQTDQEQDPVFSKKDFPLILQWGSASIPLQTTSFAEFPPQNNIAQINMDEWTGRNRCTIYKDGDTISFQSLRLTIVDDYASVASEVINTNDHRFSRSFLDHLDNVQNADLIHITGSINDSTRIYLNISLTDPATMDHYLSIHEKRLELHEVYEIPYPIRPYQVSEVTYIELAELLAHQNLKVYIDKEPQLVAYDLRLINPESEEISQKELRTRILSDQKITYPVELSFFHAGRRFIIFFGDRQNYLISYESWEQFLRSGSEPVLIRTEIAEQITFRWHTIEMQSPAYTQAYIFEWSNSWHVFHYVNSDRQKVQERNLIEMPLEEVRQLFNMNPDLWVNGTDSPAGLAISLQYRDHVGVPFRCELKYEADGHIYEEDCRNRVLEKLKAGDFIAFNFYSINPTLNLYVGTIKIM